MSSILRTLFVSATVLGALPLHAGIEPAHRSSLTGTRLPADAVRLGAEAVPGEVDEALRRLVAAAGEQARQGGVEALAWTGDGFRASNVPAMMHRLATDLERDGWTYEIAGSEGELTVFSLVRTAPQQRALLGFYTSSDEALVLAWTELLAAPAASVTPVADTMPAAPRPVSVPVSPAPPAGAKVVMVDANALHVNLMGREMPAMPQFPSVSAKPGMVRGFVRDVRGAPIAGATLGVRVTAVGGFYSGAQGETDENGYYEFEIPAGMAHFYNAGVSLDWGDGLAAMSLHPVDGKVGTFTSAQGGVENFVLLPYGITSRENLGDTPHLPSTYYGGALYVTYWTRAATDSWSPVNNLIEGSVIELTLTAEGPMLGGEPGRSFVIRKPANGSGFRINNIPVGSYSVRATLADGTPLKLSLNQPRNSVFGLSPAETTGSAQLTFAPGGARSSMAIPAYGNWDTVSFGVELP